MIMFPFLVYCSVCWFVLYTNFDRIPFFRLKSKNTRLFKSSVSVCLPINVYFRFSLILYLFGFQCLYCVLVLTTILCFINKRKRTHFSNHFIVPCQCFFLVYLFSLSNIMHITTSNPPLIS